MEEVYLMGYYVNKWKQRTEKSTTEVQGPQLPAKLINKNKEVTEDKNREQNTPSLVLSVIGDSNTLVFNQWPKSVFQEALIETAKCEKETWILYRGGSDGVSKVVKDAYKKYLAMQKTKSDQKQRIKLISTTNKEGENPSTDAKKIFQNTKDDPSFLRFETFVSQQNVFYIGPDMMFEIPVPTAIIVCEGDIQTISHIVEALEKQLPVIIMKGSGKAADLVLDYFDKLESFVIKKRFRLLFGYEFDKEEYKKTKKHLKYIKQNRDLVGVFDLHNDHPLKLSSIVGEAVVGFLTKKNIFRTNLKDASQSGIQIHEEHVETKAYVMDPKFSTPTSLPLYFSLGSKVLQQKEESSENCWKILLIEALKANRCEYVSTLLDQEVAIESRYLPDLYKWQSKNEKTLVDLFFEKNFEEFIKNGETKIKDKNLKSEETESSWILPAVRKACRRFLKYEDFKEEKEKSGKKTCTEENSNIGLSDVLLWAIIFNRRELADICWQEEDDNLLIGLVCSAILKTLSKKARGIKEDVLADALEEHSKIFEQRCICILDKINDENTEQAIGVLRKCTSVWGICSSPLTFAYENSMYDVLAHTCSKKYVDRHMSNKFQTKTCAETKLPITPRTLYRLNTINNVVGLLLYSWFVLTSTSTKYNVEESMRAVEYYVYLWRFGDFIEEVLQCSRILPDESCSRKHVWSYLKKYIYNLWNVLDWLSHLTLVVALFLRHFLQSDGQQYARNMFAFSLLFIYLRFYETFLIYKIPGTTVIMVKEMLKDLYGFISFVLFVVLGVGMYYHANLWPDHQAMWGGSWSNFRLWTILSHPYWQIFGEVDLELLTGKTKLFFLFFILTIRNSVTFILLDLYSSRIFFF